MWPKYEKKNILIFNDKVNNIFKIFNCSFILVLCHFFAQNLNLNLPFNNLPYVTVQILKALFAQIRAFKLFCHFVCFPIISFRWRELYDKEEQKFLMQYLQVHVIDILLLALKRLNAFKLQFWSKYLYWSHLCLLFMWLLHEIFNKISSILGLNHHICCSGVLSDTAKTVYNWQTYFLSRISSNEIQRWLPIEWLWYLHSMT